MVSEHLVRRLALRLSEAVEQDHHGFPSFRVGGRIFATVPAPDRLRVVLDEPGIRTAVESNPDVCAAFYWGRRLACVEVDLARADTELVRDLLADAWEHQEGKRRHRRR